MKTISGPARKAHSSRDPYNLIEDSPEHRPQLGLVLNILLVLGILGIGMLKLEKDWSWYKGQRAVYTSVLDGVVPEDVPRPDVAVQVRENLQYKDASPNAFFWAKWGPLLPAYVLAFFVPFLLGMWQLWTRGRGAKVLYFTFALVFLGYAGVWLRYWADFA